ncbi:MAG: cation:proton antiporter [Anaerolineaceae bacterium]|nr:cation:proton antiporter [Anaerolineaceae bacterium]
MSVFLQFSIILIIILLVAKLAGYFSSKIGQPSVLGELLAGLLLGPSLLNIFHLPFITESHTVYELIKEIAELGVLLLMFLAGLELHLKDLANNTKVSAYAGILGVLVPFGLGWLVGYMQGMDINHSIFLGLTLGATSVSISAQTLMELKVLRSRVGLGLLGAAVFDDILVILLLSTFLAIATGGGSILAVLLVIGKMFVFMGVFALIGIYVLPALIRWTIRKPISQGLITLTIVVLLMYGVAAELIGGMAAITGTFLAGLMFSRTPEKKLIERGIQTIAYSFFVPLFFVSIGLSIDVSTLGGQAIIFILIISSVAILSKLLGAGLGAKLANFSWRESLQIGIGMISRGEVGLIVAKIGVDNGFITSEVFSGVVGMVLITTLVTPPLLRSAFPSAGAKESQPAKPTA